MSGPGGACPGGPGLSTVNALRAAALALAGLLALALVLDRLFPRSVFYSLRLAEHSLDELHHRALNRVGATAEAQRLLGPVQRLLGAVV